MKRIIFLFNNEIKKKGTFEQNLSITSNSIEFMIWSINFLK